MPEDEKKKKKPTDDDENPFDLDDETLAQINAQVKKMLENMFPGGVFPGGMFDEKLFSKIFKDIMKQMGDPRKMANMDPKDLEKNMRQFGFKGPFLWGMNFNIGPDGKPQVNSFGNIKPKPEEGETEVRNERDPVVDIYEEGDQIVVVAEVPGVQKEDIELRAAPTELEILAQSPEDGPQKRSYRKLVSLPREIDPDVAKARYQNGILEVRLTILGPKKDSRKINID
jgi:HSP20 family protein